MHRRNSSADICGEEGSAPLEFIFLGVLLLVPIVYLIVALGAIQSHALGVESAARQVARAIATAPDGAVAEERTRRVLSAITAEYGIAADALVLDIRCAGHATGCPDAGAMLMVTVRTRVSLPLVPPVLGLDRLAQIPVEAMSAQKVSRYWVPR